MGRRRNRAESQPSASNETEDSQPKPYPAGSKPETMLVVLQDKRDELLAIIQHIAETFNQMTPATAALHKTSFDRLEKLQNEFYEIQNRIIELNVLVPVKKQVNVSGTRKSCEELIESSQQLYIKKSNKNAENSTESSENSHSKSDSTQRKVHLPKIQLPHFTGKFEEWLAFSNLFRATIHESKDLKEIEKFQFLLSLLEKEPKKLISSLEFTAPNYTVAWELLCSRFENKRRQIFHHFSQLLSMPPLKTDADLSSFLSKLYEHVNALAAIDYKMAEYGPILVASLLGKLSPFHKRRFEDSRKDCTTYPTMDEIFDFLKSECARVDDSSTKFNPVLRPQKGALIASPSKTTNCPCCKDTNHSIFYCYKFKDMSVPSRQSFVEKQNLCSLCLHPNHKKGVNCSSSHRCRHCNAAHSSFLCSASKQHPKSEPNASVTLTACTDDDLDSTVILGTALIQVQGSDGQFHPVRAVIDSAAGCSFMTQSCIRKLGLGYDYVNQPVSGIGGQNAVKIQGKLTCVIKPRIADDPILKTETLIINKITSNLPSAKLPKSVRNYYADLILADPGFDINSPVEMLLSAEVFPLIYDGNKRVGPYGMPHALSSIFGWVITGKLSRKKRAPALRSDRTALICTPTTDDLLRQFWELEEVPNKIEPHPDDVTCEKIFQERHYRQADGRYIVPMMLKDNVSDLGDSKYAALNRLYGLLRRLEKDPNLKTAYVDFLREYSDLGHMTKVGLENPASYYIPHHCVVRDSSLSTKVRVVFDASQQTSSYLSLNEAVFTGQKLQLNIFDVILRFRLGQIVFICDIEKMFRQILILPEERKYQHILWPNEDGKIQEFELNTLTYGIGSSPYLSLRVMHQLAEDEGQKYPKAAKIIHENLYIDDVVKSCDDIKTALEEQKQVTELFKLGGFELKKWASNCKQILERIPSENCVSSFTLSGGDSSLKLLGIKWDAKADSFSFSFQASPDRQMTKRNILSQIAKIYDPLGFLCPIILKAKSIMRQIWLQGIDWDSPVLPPLSQEWQQFSENLSAISDIQIDRCVTLEKTETHLLIGFSDASKLGYAASVYLRSETTTDVKISLIAAKSRVAPTKTVSIPRLELCGAHLLSNLLNHCETVLKTQIEIPQTFAFTDSEVVLDWLKTIPCLLKTFEANRVTKILETVPPSSWKFVSGTENPADVASRGCAPDQLKDHPLWWTGPPWLTLPVESWPKPELNTSKAKTKIAAGLKGKEKSVCLTVTSDSEDELISRYSSFTRLQRVIAWILRFSKNARLPKGERNTSAILSLNELRISKIRLIKMVQNKHFSGEIKNLKKQSEVSNNLKALRPFLDQEGLLRVGGRLRNANLSYDQTHPILLPKKDHFINLLIDKYHREYLHAGPRLLQSILARQFWIISARSVIRSRISKCITCFSVKPTNVSPLMGNLPPSRVNPSKVFLEVGVDFGGPFTIREHKRRNPKLGKAYLCLFVCMTTKAVHLEVVSDLTTDAFLASLDRFVSRRGYCQKIYSDNATNFTGARRQLSELFNFFIKNQDEIRTKLIARQIEWKFMPPLAPHFGGLYEAGIRSAKYHLKRVMGDQIFTFEELTTIFAKIECMMNSRPLCAISTDAAENDVLTPGHFLVGGPLIAIPEYFLLDVQLNRLSRWQLIQRTTQEFWKVWSREYIHTLHQRSKWTKDHENLKIGDLVIVADNNSRPTEWTRGIIELVHPGTDNVVRAVTVRTNSGSYRRAAVKIYRLPSA